MSTPESTVEDAAGKAAGAFRTAFQDGAKVLKDGVDKTLKNYDRLVAFGKENAVAAGQAANASAKGAESLHDELYSYSRRTMESALSAVTGLVDAKSVADALELQRSFARSSFEAWSDEMTKLSEIYLAAARESFEPFGGRFQAWLDIVQQTRTV